MTYHHSNWITTDINQIKTHMEKNENPWIALSTYEESDEYRFFGRDEDTAKLLAMVQQNDCVVIYAASGDGKSSVINAGLSPAMRRVELFPIKILFNTDELKGQNVPISKNSNSIDFDTLIWNKIVNSITQYQNRIVRENNLDDNFKIEFVDVTDNECKTDDIDLWLKLRTNVIQDSLGVSNYIPVLIFDQFEEVLRCPWRAQFFEWLDKLLKDIPPLTTKDKQNDMNHLRKLFKMVFSMRYEYVGELDYWCSQRYFIPQLMQNRYFLKPISKNQAIDIIKSTGTFDGTSKKLSDNADLIIENITASNLNAESDDEIPAITLSLTCYVLYNEWQENETFALNNVGLSDTIYNYYKTITSSLGLSDTQRIGIENVLISNKGTRLRIPLSDERLQSFDINNFISGEQNLFTEHVLKREESNGEVYVEFIHDKLADAIHKKRGDISTMSLRKTRRFWLNIISVVSLIFIFIWFTNYSLTHHKYDYRTDDTLADCTFTSNDIIINQLQDLQSNKNEFSRATSLEFSSDFDFCRSYRDCYKNVCYISDHPVYYAGNARNLCFAQPWVIDTLKFGDNTRKIIVLYPERIGSIETSTPLTKVYVPFNKYKPTLLDSGFKNVNVVEMGWFETLYERLSYRVHTAHTHIFGIEIPSWIIWLLVTIFITIVWLYYDLQKAKSRQIKLWIIFRTLVFCPASLLGMFILSIEFEWIGWNINNYVLGPILLVGGGFVIYTIIYTTIKNRIKQKYKYSIGYTSSDGKKKAILIKNILCQLGIDESSIYLDLLMCKNKYLDLERLKNSFQISAHRIIILEAEDIDNQTPIFKQVWKIVESSFTYTHPIISGKITTSSDCLPKALRNKRGDSFIYPPIYIDSIDSENIIPSMYKSLIDKKLPAENRFWRIYFILSAVLVAISFFL